MVKLVWVCGLGLGVACGPGTAGTAGTVGTAGTSGTVGTSGASGTSSGTGDSVVTGGPGTTLSDVTSDSTASASMGMTSEVTVTTSTTGGGTCDEDAPSSTGFPPLPGDVPNCVDPQVEWLSEHVDCVVDCSTMTQLHGEGPASGIGLARRITFGVVYGVCGSGLQLRRLHLGSPLAPQAILLAQADCGLDPWLGAHSVGGMLPDETKIAATMTIDSYAGDWVSTDPADPPRLFGTLSGDIVGPFEAVHCAALDLYYDNCA